MFLTVVRPHLDMQYNTKRTRKVRTRRQKNQSKCHNKKQSNSPPQASDNTAHYESKWVSDNTHTRTHARTHARHTLTHTHTDTHTRKTHTLTHTHTHTHTHDTHTHTHTDTHTLVPFLLLFCWYHFSLRVCVCVCARACVRACVRVCVCVCCTSIVIMYNCILRS